MRWQVGAGVTRGGLTKGGLTKQGLMRGGRAHGWELFGAMPGRWRLVSALFSC